MIISVLRQVTCILLCLTLFIACNASRHIVSDKAAREDQEYIAVRNQKIAKLFNTASSLIGAPYRSGSSGPKAFDCSGFTTHVFQSIHLSLPRMATEQAHIGNAVKLAMVKAGDLLFFGGHHIDHVAMVSRVKSNKVYIVHATTGNGVMEQVLQDSAYWLKRFKGARRVII